MKNLRITETVELQDSELLEIIGNHTGFSTPTLIFCYAEIKRRELVLSNDLLNALKEFSDSKEIDNLDDEVSKLAKSRGNNSYQELYENLMGVQNKQNEQAADVIPQQEELPAQKKGKESQNAQITNKRDSNYKVCPFNPSNNIPNSLQKIIDSEAVNGWKYVNHQYSDKLKPGSAGCFGIGATPDTTIHVGFVVFEKS